MGVSPRKGLVNEKIMVFFWCPVIRCRSLALLVLAWPSPVKILLVHHFPQPDGDILGLSANLGL
jgi:hypothetical protein